MPRSLWTGASGMSAQQTNVDVIANNIANVNTAGFKQVRTNFQDLFYDIRTMPGAKSGDDGQNPTGTQIGHGVRVSGTPRVFTSGTVDPTNRQTDIAIEGDGFYEVTLPNGEAAYTRAGDFSMDRDGNLVTPDGYYLEPRITIPDETEQITISTNGLVTVLVNGVQSDVGNITLTRFRNPGGLMALGRNLFQETEASGTPQQGTPADPGYGSLRQGSLEKSNVDVVMELVNMIVAQRAYELNSRSIRTSDEMLQAANDIAS